MLRPDLIKTELAAAHQAVNRGETDATLEILVREAILYQPEDGLFTEDQVKAVALAYAACERKNGGPG